MPWQAFERVQFRCRGALSRAYLRFRELAGDGSLRSLVDRQFYLERYPDLASSGIEPAAHFLLFGARELRQPHPLFDTAYYLRENPDVAATNVNPLLHFLRSGWKEGRRPNPLFDPSWYAEQHGLKPDVNPLLDYVRRQAAGERVSPRPSLRDFLSHHPLPSGITGKEFQAFAVSAAGLKQCGKPVILAISHSLGGGVAEYVSRLTSLLTGQAEFLLLTPSGSAVILESKNPDYAFSLAIDPRDDYDALLHALQQCGVARLHIQHLAGHLLDIRRLQRDLAVPFDFSVHDYFTICPQMHLNDPHGRYCGEPSEADCDTCLSARPASPPLPIGEWRRRNAWLLRDAARVIAPSFDTAQRIRRHAPGLEVVAAAHPDCNGPFQQRDAAPLSLREPMRIAILGMLSPHKGLELVRQCSRLARRRRLPLEFLLIGHPGPTLPAVSAPFRQTGRYENGALPQILSEARPHLVWFAGQVPETHSFTLGSALQAGLPVVVPKLGALPERVAGLSWAWIVPPICSAEHMISFFLQLREQHFLPHLPPAPPHGPPAAARGFYEKEYLQPALGFGFLPLPAAPLGQ